MAAPALRSAVHKARMRDELDVGEAWSPTGGARALSILAIIEELAERVFRRWSPACRSIGWMAHARRNRTPQAVPAFEHNETMFPHGTANAFRALECRGSVARYCIRRRGSTVQDDFSYLKAADTRDSGRAASRSQFEFLDRSESSCRMSAHMLD
jgi:hypothetical protein